MCSLKFDAGQRFFLFALNIVDTFLDKQNETI